MKTEIDRRDVPEGWDMEGALAEIVSTRDTAELVARDGAADGSDTTRVLAGLIAQLAEQVQRVVEHLVDGDRQPSR